MTALPALLERLEGVRRSGDGWTARCPAHKDRNPSLKIDLGRGGVLLLRCHAGCSLESVADSLGTTVRELLHGSGGPSPGSKGKREARKPSRDWLEEAQRAREGLTPERLRWLAERLHVAPGALADLGVGWVESDTLRRLKAGGSDWQDRYPPGAFTFPERDAAGRVVGLALRTADGRKGAPKGARRGLIVPSGLESLPDPVLVVEGASDVAACRTLGLTAIGRPSNRGGTLELAELLAGRAVLVVGERDEKPNGDWPGRDGARAVCRGLQALGPVQWTLPPERIKDVRELLGKLVEEGLDTEDQDACAAAGAKLLAELTRTATTESPEAESADTGEKRNTADQLLEIALARYRLGVSPEGVAFAVEREGPNVALPLSGSSQVMRRAVVRGFRRKHGRVPASSAVTDALSALEGEAHESTPERVFLRCAPHSGGIVLDLGEPEGRVVHVDENGWRVLDRSPVVFWRTALTHPLPLPHRGGDVAELWSLVRVAMADRPLVLAWILHAFVPGEPQPILLLGGEQGSSKTTTAEFLVGIIDPSAAPTRAEPRDGKQWATTAAASRVVALDNISRIPDWFSDALCRAVTGDAWVDRALYTDSDLVVRRFQRVLLLTSIDTGAMRGDLGDRLLQIDLDRITPEQRKPKRELDELYQELRPQVLGAVLDLLAQVLRVLPSVQVDELPRMADFSRMLAAMDEVCGSDGLARYASQSQRVAEDVVEGDPVALALFEFVQSKGSWSGTASDLLELIAPDPRPRGWPRSPRALSGRLRRASPALRQMGVEVEPPPESARPRVWSMRLSQAGAPEEARDSSDATVEPSEDGTDGIPEPDVDAANAATVAPSVAFAGGGSATVRLSDTATVEDSEPVPGHVAEDSRRSDGSDGAAPTSMLEEVLRRFDGEVVAPDPGDLVEPVNLGSADRPNSSGGR